MCHTETFDALKQSKGFVRFRAGVRYHPTQDEGDMPPHAPVYCPVNPCFRPQVFVGPMPKFESNPLQRQCSTTGRWRSHHELYLSRPDRSCKTVFVRKEIVKSESVHRPTKTGEFGAGQRDVCETKSAGSILLCNCFVC